MYNELTRPWYGKAVGLPWSLFWPQKRRNKIVARLRAPYAADNLMTDAELEALV